VGPLKDIAWVKRVADAHKDHHKLPHMGAPYGLFLGPEELVAAKKEVPIAGMPAWLKFGLAFTTLFMSVGLLTGV
jgi:hypothetical protein